MAVKIRLLRMGKIRNPQYRIVVADSRTKRDGRAIEYIGLYHPKEDPSRIEVNSDRAQYWLSVGAQPSQPVLRILEKTGDWQKYKGLPAPPPLLVAAVPVDRRARYDLEAQAAAGLAPAETSRPAKKAAKKAEPAADKSAADKPAADKSAADKPAADKPAEKAAAEKPAAVEKPAEVEKPAAVDEPAVEVPAQTEEPAGADAGSQA